MSLPNDVYLGVTGDMQLLSAFGRTLSIKHRLKVREAEAASGKLMRDITARKNDFTIAYEIVDQSTVNRLDYLMSLRGPWFLEITHLAVTTTYTVLMDAFDRTRLLAVGEGLWSGLSVNFREV